MLGLLKHDQVADAITETLERPRGLAMPLNEGHPRSQRLPERLRVMNLMDARAQPEPGENDGPAREHAHWDGEGICGDRLIVARLHRGHGLRRRDSGRGRPRSAARNAACGRRGNGGGRRVDTGPRQRFLRRVQDFPMHANMTAHRDGGGTQRERPQADKSAQTVAPRSAFTRWAVQQQVRFHIMAGRHRDLEVHQLFHVVAGIGSPTLSLRPFLFGNRGFTRPRCKFHHL